MGTLVSPLVFPAPSPANSSTPSRTSYFPSPSAPLQRHSNPLFLRVPVDVVLSIVDHLDPATIISLALTCRDLFALCASNHAWDLVRRPPPNSGDSENRKWRFDLLQLLMRDMPSSMMNCNDCSILHQPRVAWEGPGPLQHPWEILGYKCASKPSSYRLQRAGLEDSNTQAIAPAPETAVTHLQSTTTVQSFQSHEVWLQVNWYAKIIDGELYLKSVHGVRAYGLAAREWATVLCGLKKQHLPLCQHASLPDRAFVPAIEIPHVRRGSCSKCHTEFQTVSIGQAKAPQPRGQFFVETYYRLGGPMFASESAKQTWEAAIKTESAAHHLGATEAWSLDSRAGYFHPHAREVPHQTSEVKSLEDSVTAITSIWRDRTAALALSEIHA